MNLERWHLLKWHIWEAWPTIGKYAEFGFGPTDMSCGGTSHWGHSVLIWLSLLSIPTHTEPVTANVTSSAFLLLDTLSCYLWQLLHPVPYFLSKLPSRPGCQLSRSPYKCLWLFWNISPWIFLFSSNFLWVLPGFSISRNDPRLLAWSSKFCSYQHLWFPCTPSLCSISQTTPQAWLSVILCLHAYLVARENFLSLVENTYPWSPTSPSSSAPRSILSFLGSLSVASYITEKSSRPCSPHHPLLNAYSLPYCFSSHDGESVDSSAHD